jgi:hypothetical protein
LNIDMIDVFAGGVLHLVMHLREPEICKLVRHAFSCIDGRMPLLSGFAPAEIGAIP